MFKLGDTFTFKRQWFIFEKMLLNTKINSCPYSKHIERTCVKLCYLLTAMARASGGGGVKCLYLPSRLRNSTFHGTRRIITVFTRTLFWTSSLKPIPSHLISVRFTIILLNIGLGFLPWGFRYKMFPFLLLALCLSSHFSWLHRPNNIGRRVQIMKYIS
jgi:hypothetical protein